MKKVLSKNVLPNLYKLFHVALTILISSRIPPIVEGVFRPCVKLKHCFEFSRYKIGSLTLTFCMLNRVYLNISIPIELLIYLLKRIDL